MNKFIKSVLGVGICALFLVGCSNSEKPKNTEFNNKEQGTASSDKTGSKAEAPNKEQGTTPSNESNDSNKGEGTAQAGGTSTSDAASNKEIYLNKLDQLEADLNITLKEKEAGTTLEMGEAASERYEKWDGMLNEIYSILKDQLSQEEMDKLTEEEEEWINTKEEKAEEAANQYKGGSFESVNRALSLVDSTKNRCYELVNKYMK